MSIVDEAAFRNPPIEYGPLAMWFLNGSLAPDELRRQIGAMAAGRVGGIQVAARTGLETPYLSARWFELVELIQDAAEQHGIPLWLADEYPYPSGASGGEVVLRHPEYRAWQMQARRVRIAPGGEVQLPAPGTVALRACAVPVVDRVARWPEAIDLEAQVGWLQHEQLLFEPTRVYLTTRRYMSSGPRPTLSWHAPEGPDEWEVWLIAAAEITEYKFFGSYVDLCNADACQLFLSTTYERYLARLGPERFVRLAGFFLDEAHPQNWSWRLPRFFQQRRGYDLLEALPALWTDVGPETARVRYDYHQSLTDLFDQSFMRPVAEWSQQRGVQLSLEVPSTRNVAQRHAAIPGIDPGHDKVGVPLDDILARELPSYRGNLNFPASLAAQTGRRRVLDELFHSVGWSLTLQDMKAMLDRAAARGANVFAFHAFCYTIGGLRKWDAPPSEFEQNPYWPHFPLLAGYAARLAYALSRGRRVAPIAVVDPITSVWAHSVLPGLQHDEIAQRIMQDWTSVMRELLAAQRPHDNLDPLLLAEATVERARLRIGEAQYQVVVLPSITNLERSAWTKLEEFVAGGGTVIACGLLPREDIELESQVAERCRAAFDVGALRGFARVQSTSELLHFLDTCVPADLRLVPESGEEARRPFLLAQRREGDQDLFFLANASMAEATCEVSLRTGDSAVMRLDLDTGQVEPLDTWRGDDDTRRLRLDFPRHGSHLLLVSPEAAEPAGTAPDGTHAHDEAARGRPADDRGAAPVLSRSSGDRGGPPVVDLDLAGDWRCELTGDALNALRLDRFRFTLTEADPDAEAPDGVRWPQQVAIVEPKPLVNLFHDLSLAGAHWPGRLEAQPVFGAPPRIGLQLPVSAWYASTFEARTVPRRALLCIEDLALAGDWEVWVNQQPVARDAFVPRRRWSIDNREADVTSLLTARPNEVLVRVRVRQPSDGLLDALYLLGDFGVFHDHDGAPLLGERPAVVRWSERHTAGYPYFSGTLRLSRDLPLSVPAGAFRLRLPDEELMFAGVVELELNGQSLGPRAWAPFVWDVPAGLVSTGVAELSLSVTNTLVEQLEGKRYDRHRREVVPVRPQRVAASTASAFSSIEG